MGLGVVKVTGLKQLLSQGPRNKSLSFPEDMRPRLASCGVVDTSGTALVQLFGQGHPCWYVAQERF